MTWTDNDLMAHVDGELPPARRAELDAALAQDPALQARAQTLRQQRQRLSAAFAGVLDEPPPERLTALLAEPAAAAATRPPPVIDMADARQRREAQRAAQAAAEAARRTARPGSFTGRPWPQWAGLAASVALGMLLGWQLALRNEDSRAISGPVSGSVSVSLSGPALLATAADGRLLADGPLADALAHQLSHPVAGSSAPITMQLSFQDHDGRYCRTFATPRLAGLACREGDAWAVATTAAVVPGAVDAASSPGLRQAATALPRGVLEAVDERVAGEVLSAEGERAALARGWAH